MALFSKSRFTSILVNAMQATMTSPAAQPLRLLVLKNGRYIIPRLLQEYTDELTNLILNFFDIAQA